MKSFFGLLLFIAISGNAAAQNPCDVTPSRVYGYRYDSSVAGSNACFKTLEEAEYALRTDPQGGSLPSQALAFPIPGDFFSSPYGLRALDYRPNGAISPSGAVLTGPATTVVPKHSVYVKGWPRANPVAACTTGACAGGFCRDMASQVSCVEAEFDATWQTDGIFQWIRQGSAQSTNNITGDATRITGVGQSTGSLFYSPASSTAAGWGSTISITAVPVNPMMKSTNEIEASTQWNWNIQREDQVTCQGARVNSGATSTGNACKADYIKSIISSPSPTQTSGGCGDGDPCFAANGNNQVIEKGFRYGEISLDLFYNSLRQTRPYSYIDRNWSHTFTKRLITEWVTDGHVVGADTQQPLNTEAIIVQDERAHLEIFKAAPTGSGVFRSTNTSGSVLIFNPGQGSALRFWELIRENGVTELFDRAGRLIKIIYPDEPKKTLTLSYLGSPLPTVPYYVSDNDIPRDEEFWRLGSVTDGTGRSITFEYSRDQFLWLTDIKADGGGTALLHFDYDSAHRLIRSTFADMSSRQYLYNEAGSIFVGGSTPAGITGYWLTGIKDENGRRFTTNQYDTWGRVIANWHGNGAEKVVLTYPVSSIDATATVTMPAGNQVTYAYASSEPYRHVGSKQDSIGTWNYQYDSGGRQLTQKVDPNGNITKLEYDPNGIHVIAVTEAFNKPEQRRVETSWDSVTNRVKGRAIYAKPNNGTATLESRTTYNYEAATGRITDVSQIDGVTGNIRKWKYTYCTSTDPTTGCAAGFLQTIDGPRTDAADSTTYTYYTEVNLSGCNSGSSGVCHRIGDLKTTTNALGHVTKYISYDKAGRLTRTQDVNNVIVDYEYNARGWLAKQTIRASTDGAPSANDASIRLEYDGSGNITKMYQPDGTFLSYNYDDAHRLIKATDNLNNSVDYCPGGAGSRQCIDAAGNQRVEQFQSPSGGIKRSLSRAYNQINQLTSVLNAAGSPIEQSDGISEAGVVDGYDRNGNRVLVEDGFGTVTRRAFDGLNRLIEVIRNFNGSGSTSNTRTKYAYDARGNVRSITDPEGLSTTYDYDGLNNLTGLHSPDTGNTSYTYDLAGNKKTQTDANGLTSTYAFDALNRLIGVTYSVAENNVSYMYDQSNAVTGCPASYPIGRLTTMIDFSGSTSYCYDNRGNITRKKQVAGTVTLTIAYAYTLADQLSSITYPSGAVVAYTRDSLSRITGVTWKANATATPATIISGATYYPFGPLNVLTYGGGRTLTKTYDQDYAIDSIASSIVDGFRLDLGVDVMGNITSAVRPNGDISLAPPQQYPQTYAYDPLYRMQQIGTALTVGTIEAYSYNKTGDRMSAQRLSEPPISYSYVPGTHRLANVGGIVRAYDGNGNTKEGIAADLSLVYDVRNRLSVATRSNATINYAYNGRGERVWKKNTRTGTSADLLPAPQVVRFVYDDSGQILGEYGGTGVLQAEYIYLDSVPIAVAKDTGLAYVETDHLGTPRLVFDPATNATKWAWNFLGNSFGADAPDQVPGGGQPYVMNLRFPGQYFDAETGLNYNYFRNYEPATGRYIESDPISLKGGISTYSYASSSPLQKIDPFGLFGYLPPDSSQNTTVCDGDGNIYPQIQIPVNPFDRSCVGDCILLHELTHVMDLRALGPGGCKGKPKGTRVTFDTNQQLNDSESKSFHIEIECLQEKLARKQRCEECDPLVQKRIEKLQKRVEMYD